MMLKTVSRVVVISTYNVKKACYNLLVHSILVFALSIPAKSQNVLTQHNDLQRTGWNASETQLTQANVSDGGFGKIFSRTVDDQIYCQPLIVNNVTIAGGQHNVLIIATVSNTVYAFDADDPNATTAYWTNNLTFDPGNYRPVNNSDVGQTCGAYSDFSGNIGIVGTPVIDAAAGIIYVVSRSVSKTTNNFVQYIHALKITDGSEIVSPVSINPTTTGTGTSSDGCIFLSISGQKINAPDCYCIVEQFTYPGPLIVIPLHITAGLWAMMLQPWPKNMYTAVVRTEMLPAYG